MLPDLAPLPQPLSPHAPSSPLPPACPLSQVDPATHAIAVEDFCLDGEHELVQCHDVEPFYPVTPYHSQRFMCFEGTDHHTAGALCVAPADLEALVPGSATHGRLAAFEDSLWPLEEERRARQAVAAQLVEQAQAAAVAAAGTAQVGYGAAACVAAAAVAVALRRRRAAARTATTAAAELL